LRFSTKLLYEFSHLPNALFVFHATNHCCVTLIIQGNYITDIPLFSSLEVFCMTAGGATVTAIAVCCELGSTPLGSMYCS
jgi:hypothetical protein